MADMEVLAPGGHQHLVEKIKEQLAMKADASLASAVEKVIENQPTAVLSGTVLSAADAYAEPPVSLTVDGKSTQDGTPTPDAPVEIVSVENPELTFAGRNLLNPATCIANKFLWGDGSLGSGDGWYVTDYINAAANTTYTLTGNTATSATAQFCFYDSGKTFIGSMNAQVSNRTFTTPDGTAYVRLSIKTADISTCQFELGGEATAYEPYAGNTVTLPVTLRSLPDGTHDTLALSYLRPSTREGWAWYTPTLAQNVGHVADMGELTWSRTRGAATSENAWKFAANVPDRRANNSHIVCSGFATGGNIGVSAVLTEGLIYGRQNYRSVLIRWDAITDATEFATFVTGMELDYILDTPAITTLDPIELPVLPAPDVTVWSDPSTGLQMRYVRDMQIVIDSLNSEIERAYAAIAPVESTTAKSNHAVGDYLMLGGTLCKVTSAIASGETIAIGTNVTATTVDAELASLE